MDYIPAFKESLFDHPITDVASDVAEFGIDTVLTDGPLKELPIFSLVLGTAKVVRSVRELNLLKNTATFICEMYSKKISTEKMLAYKKHLEDERFAEQELGRVLILLDRHIDSVKSRMLAILYKRYIEQEYDWGKFCELSDVLERLFIEDLPYLESVKPTSTESATYHIINIPYNLKRLESIGLVDIGGNYKRFGNLVWQEENVCVSLTTTGRIILEAVEAKTNIGK